MLCVKCKSPTREIASKVCTTGVRRRRRCACGQEFTTWEARVSNGNRPAISRAQVLTLRKRGLVYREIGERLGASTTTAWAIGEGVRGV